MAVRLFIGNLPYGASEADLRAHFAAVAEPSHVAMPVDRETGRPRGFAFVEFADRAVAEEVIRKFDSQPFQGRPLAVSEARAREDRPPRPPGGGFAPRPAVAVDSAVPPGRWRIRRSSPTGGGGFGGPRPGPRRPATPGPEDATEARTSVHLRRHAGLRGKKTTQQEHKPRGPIKEKTGGRIYDVDDLEDDSAVEIDDVATKADDGPRRPRPTTDRRRIRMRNNRTLGVSVRSSTRFGARSHRRRRALRHHHRPNRIRRNDRERQPSRARVSSAAPSQRMLASAQDLGMVHRISR